jgi:hypothetical protein
MFPMSEGDKPCSENPNIKTTSVKLTPGCRSLFVLVFFSFGHCIICPP